jgi:hypothetical protein
MVAQAEPVARVARRRITTEDNICKRARNVPAAH